MKKVIRNFRGAYRITPNPALPDSVSPADKEPLSSNLRLDYLIDAVGLEYQEWPQPRKIIK